ncbi:hypothetical protein MLD38_035273 [Melastoma candidum]|uniref:Uncharacterized protein n=1 Tax=Melastoma candidum TaxID=119954 RepID=A0ACB9MCI3_9MYRT|nr:hypothetical protein MLD38_035273 [Melastoma candidum]
MKIAGGAKPPARRRSRVSRSGGPGSRRGSRPGTPLLKWKTEEDEEEERNGSVLPVEEEEDDVRLMSDGRMSRRRSEGGLSARKLAAGLWRLQVSPEEKDGFCKVKVEVLAFVFRCLSFDFGAGVVLGMGAVIVKIRDFE